MKKIAHVLAVATLLIAASEGGFADGQDDLGMICDAANMGNLQAQLKLGFRHQVGVGVPQSDDEAARWYLAAAEHGHAGAQTIVGLMYSLGQGLPQSDQLAQRWLGRAMAQGEKTTRLLAQCGWIQGLAPLGKTSRISCGGV
ncbi:MAG: sel1 repeat family protein [Magnetococcales bacterium]|nr:sel1 repeat family protein [Magnetococcales bacterium]